ncbi:CBS domain-containing protein [Haloechinothrix halophila]|uniref:CBS domain-containing protein n=1 Tax=Haloechinothrix halophila TaxID=1069073 RepID=UPI0003FA48A6|nr:CBS domain-containing protein [Haloechinothrix halophila]
MSPRAACRLEQLGFTDVYDYVPGKSDWMAAGLPRGGESAQTPYAGDLASHDVPTCPIGDPLATAEKALREHRVCVVVSADSTVVGALYPDDLRNSGPDATIDETMHPGPTTVRANEPVDPLLERMRHADIDGILVTDPEGRLLGLFHRHHAA